jgi:SagB-type dehydrogenase family enzyme
MDTLLRLRLGASVGLTADGETTLITGDSGISLGMLTAGQHAMLAALATTASTEPDLVEIASDMDGSGAASAYALLSVLRARHWLSLTLKHRGRHLVSAHPTSTSVAAPASHGRPDGEVMLSRFAVLHRTSDGLILESPLSPYEILIHDPSVAYLIGELAEPMAVDGPQREVVELLVACGLVVAEDSSEDTDIAIAQWSPHELWFHARSRQGTREWGGTYWARGRSDPPPALREPAGGPVIPLYQPDLSLVAAQDPPLTEVVENRRSVRSHDDRSPVTIDQLGEFLYRTARTRRTWTGEDMAFASRPYPGGGAIHELELYPVVRHVTGLAAGVYHYDGASHGLELLTTDNALVRKVIAHAADAAAVHSQPQVVIVITARFSRVMWKYQSMAYSLTLKNVGVLLGVMYWVATAMRLAPCALGGGTARLLDSVVGAEPLSEAGVGEFILGSRKE